MLPPRAYLFLSLNAVRALSIISLLLVFSSTIVVMVTNIKAVNAFDAHRGDVDMEDCDYIEGSTVPNQAAGVFWAIVSSLLIIFQTIILLLSEMSWPMSFFDKYFPVLGSGFGLGALGIFQCLIATQILSHHVDDFALVSAFFLFSLGCLNMLLGLVFRESAKEKRSIRAWRSDGQGFVPSAKDNRPVFVNASPAFMTNAFAGEKDHRDSSSTDHDTWKPAPGNEKQGYGFGRQGEKAAGLRGFILKKPEESLPRYASPSQPSSAHKSQRASSTRSSSSSFMSPYRESIQSSAPPSRSQTPVFKSSGTAI